MSREKRCVVCNNIIKHQKSIVILCSAECAAKAADVYASVSGRKFRALNEAADRALRFWCGLNLQDHNAREQRQALEVNRNLMRVLDRERAKK